MSPTWSRVVQLLGLVIVQAIILRVSAGTIRWSAGWWYLGLYLLLLIFGAAFLNAGGAQLYE
jgi:hypothetical protein